MSIPPINIPQEVDALIREIKSHDPKAPSDITNFLERVERATVNLTIEKIDQEKNLSPKKRLRDEGISPTEEEKLQATKEKESMESLRKACIQHGLGEENQRIYRFIHPVDRLSTDELSHISSFTASEAIGNRAPVNKAFKSATDIDKVNRLNEGMPFSELGLNEASLLSLLQREGEVVVCLNLSYAPISDIAGVLSLCPNLEHLTSFSLLADPHIIEKIAPHPNAQKLKSLCLRYHMSAEMKRICGIEHLPKSIQFLDLGKYPIGIEEARHIAAMSNLKTLSIGRDFSTQTLQEAVWIKEIAKSTSLAHLDLFDYGLTFEELKEIAKMPNLETLKINTTNLTLQMTQEIIKRPTLKTIITSRVDLLSDESKRLLEERKISIVNTFGQGENPFKLTL